MLNPKKFINCDTTEEDDDDWVGDGEGATKKGDGESVEMTLLKAKPAGGKGINPSSETDDKVKGSADQSDNEWNEGGDKHDFLMGPKEGMNKLEDILDSFDKII